MPRVKVLSDASDLVPLLRAFDSETKRAVFDALTSEWVTADRIREEYGPEGVEALGLLENAHLVETRWASGKESPEKAYRSFYTGFHLNMQSDVSALGDLLGAATLSSEAFAAFEEDLVELAREGVSAKDAQKKLGVSASTLRGLVKRSTRVDAKGQSLVVRE